MDRDDVEGAVAAAQYFLELYPYAYNTGDLEQWKAMSHPECVFCASVVENVEALHADGGYQTGGDIEWREVTAELGPDLRTAMTASVDATASQVPTLQTLGNVTEEISTGGTAHLFIDLVRSEGWLVRGVDVDGETDP